MWILVYKCDKFKVCSLEKRVKTNCSVCICTYVCAIAVPLWLQGQGHVLQIQNLQHIEHGDTYISIWRFVPFLFLNRIQVMFYTSPCKILNLCYDPILALGVHCLNKLESWSVNTNCLFWISRFLRRFWDQTYIPYCKWRGGVRATEHVNVNNNDISFKRKAQF